MWAFYVFQKKHSNGKQPTGGKKGGGKPLRPAKRKTPKKGGVSTKDVEKPDDPFEDPELLYKVSLFLKFVYI